MYITSKQQNNKNDGVHNQSDMDRYWPMTQIYGLGNGCKWMEWMEMDGNGWKWMEMDGNNIYERAITEIL